MATKKKVTTDLNAINSKKTGLISNPRDQKLAATSATDEGGKVSTTRAGLS